jgi:hypothetical protein
MTWLKYIILLKLFKTIFCLIFTYTVLFKKKIYLGREISYIKHDFIPLNKQSWPSIKDKQL